MQLSSDIVAETKPGVYSRFGTLRETGTPEYSLQYSPRVLGPDEADSTASRINPKNPAVYSTLTTGQTARLSGECLGGASLAYKSWRKTELRLVVCISYFILEPLLIFSQELSFSSGCGGIVPVNGKYTPTRTTHTDMQMAYYVVGDTGAPCGAAFAYNIFELHLNAYQVANLLSQTRLPVIIPDVLEGKPLTPADLGKPEVLAEFLNKRGTWEHNKDKS
ncbi:hypothetical protein H4R99_006883 [Coemansia sp. RSA 1722]|nr:hypothetical protein H4R99_006883 [Coemansia sp. RSA 1722]